MTLADWLAMRAKQWHERSNVVAVFHATGAYTFLVRSQLVLS